VLQQADDVTGPYTDIVPQQSSPYLFTPSATKKFFRVRLSESGVSSYQSETQPFDIFGGILQPPIFTPMIPTPARPAQPPADLASGGLVARY
jgi:hypothetical protein